MKKIILLLGFLIVLFCLKGCNTSKMSNNENGTHTGDSMEKSAYLKKDLPWFAQFQVGESPVVGFPNETSEEKKVRMQ